MKNIAVIGAGMAGLACAQTLQQAGFLVTVFEKSRGPSGRVSTRQGEGWQADHGAQYFTVSVPAFAAQVARWQHAGLVSAWQGRMYESHAGAIQPKLSKKIRYVGIPGNTAPAKRMAESLEVALEHTVISIQYGSGQWTIHSKEHGAYPQVFDQLVLALPAPQAYVLLNSTQSSLIPLVAGVTMRGCWALMARYTQSLALPFDGLFVNDGLLSWVARDSSKPGRIKEGAASSEVWVLHASAAWSEANLERDANEVAVEMQAAFVALGGAISPNYSIHRWRYADCLQPLQHGYAHDEALSLALCGDWLNGGKVEGAWMSGFLLANAISSKAGTCR